MERRDSKRSIFKALFTGFYENNSVLCNRVAFSCARNNKKWLIPAPHALLTAILDPLVKANPPKEYVRLAVIILE